MPGPFLREDEPWQHELWYGPAEPPPGSVSRTRASAGLGLRVKQVHADVEFVKFSTGFQGVEGACLRPQIVIRASVLSMDMSDAGGMPVSSCPPASASRSRQNP